MITFKDNKIIIPAKTSVSWLHNWYMVISTDVKHSIEFEQFYFKYTYKDIEIWNYDYDYEGKKYVHVEKAIIQWIKKHITWDDVDIELIYNNID